MKKIISTLVGIIIIIAVAVVLFGGVFAYQYFTKAQQNSEFFGSSQKTNQAQTQTAGWKTFTSNKYGFEVKIPIDELLSQDGFSMQEYDFKDPSYKQIYITTLKYGCDFYVFPNIDDKFLSLVNSGEDQVSILERGGKKYYFGSNAGSHAIRVSDCVPVFNQMLSTFKFTK